MKKKLINIILAVAISVTSFIPVHAETEPSKEESSIQLPYEDVDSADWYYKFVCDVYEKKLMAGYSDIIFGAEDNLQRAQFAAILWRIAGSPDAEYKPTYSDVPDNQYYTKAVMWASENGIIAGYTGNKFGSYDNITREQIATMMYRYAKYVNRDVSIRKDISEFSDVNKVSVFAKDAIEWCVAESVLSGEGSTGELNPQGYTLRAVCATIISRFTNEDVHTHTWVDVTETINHPAETKTETRVVKEAWTEEVPVYETVAREICNGCGKDVTDIIKKNGYNTHAEEQMMQGNFACGGCYTDYRKERVGTDYIEHPAVTEEVTVTVKEAWTEVKVVGQKCSGCGIEK